MNPTTTLLLIFLNNIILTKCKKVFDINDDYLLNNLIKEEKERFVLYKLTLSDIPFLTNAEDFKVDLIGSQFLMVTVNNTNIQWRITLENRVPNNLIFYPEFSVSLLSSYKKLSTWEIYIRIPKFYTLAPTVMKGDEL